MNDGDTVVVRCVGVSVRSGPVNQTSLQESSAVARKSRDAAAVLFSLNIHYASLRVAKLRNLGFRAPNIPAQNRI